MNNIDEQLSALMDGEKSDINLILNNMKNRDVRDRWKRYHLIRDVMRNQVSKVDKHDVSLKIHDAILNEPTLMSPASLNIKKKPVANGGLFKQLGSMAIAATVTAVAILVVQQNSGLTENKSTIIAAQPVAPQEKFFQTASTRNIELNKAVAAKLNGYLVNHNEYATSFGMQGAIPYTRVVNFNPTVKIVQAIDAK